ncbi:flagellar filament capping protein FliD [Devosia sp. MC521]|uniref:flagellar filament capping protein FliD n=1 Tax=Devosia sp. MC521 TaxID=2759954 RepID=UPI0015F9359C|nr:flagellar filament capping protein FliD [Devosia sp. MC521]MBJ6988011.1 flagellar filament capping protein FliD [Devosia sp. MC521]QMW62083.1 flagellar filament capping protein FliD [Devosia sp. MC521]
MSTVSTTSSATPAATTTVVAAPKTSTTKPVKEPSDGTNIDWAGLIEESVNAKLAKATSIDLKIDANDLKMAAYQDAKNLLSSLQTAANALRAPSGSTARSTDAFLSRSAYLTANGNVNAASVFSATVDPAADQGTYKLEVVQLATAHKISSGTVATKTSDLNITSVISLGVEGGPPSTLSITADMSLMEISEAINKTKASSGVQASIVQVTPNDFRLILTATETGKSITSEVLSGDDALGALGLTNPAGDFATVLQDAQQAIVRVDDLEVTRSSNEISDIITGTTLYLYQATPPGTSITLEVDANVNNVKTAILQLVEAYNAYRDFAVKQQTLPSRTYDPPLFGDGTMRSVNASIGDALATAIGSESMSLLGLTYDNQNKLVIEEDKLDNILLTNLSAVQNLLSFGMTTSNTNIQLLARGSSLPPDFTLDIETDVNGVLTGATVNGQAGLFTVSGSRLVGAAGTAYEGISLVYTGNSPAAVDLSFKTGIAEKLFNAANGATSGSGSLTLLINNLSSQSTEMTKRSDNIRSQAEAYRTTISMRYARYQAAIAQADSMKDYLSTLLDTWNAKS